MESIGGGYKSNYQASSASQIVQQKSTYESNGKEQASNTEGTQTDVTLVDELRASRSFHSRKGLGSLPVAPLPVPYPPPPTSKHFYSLVFLDNKSNSISIHNRQQIYPLNQTLCQTGLSEAEGAAYLYSSLRDAVTTESSKLICHEEAKDHTLGVGKFAAWCLTIDERPLKLGRKIVFGLIRLIDLKPIPLSLAGTLPRPLAPGSIEMDRQPLPGSSSFEGLSWRVHPSKDGTMLSQGPVNVSSSLEVAAALIDKDIRASQTLPESSAQLQAGGSRPTLNLNPPTAAGPRAQAAAEKTRLLIKQVEEMEKQLMQARHGL